MTDVSPESRLPAGDQALAKLTLPSALAPNLLKLCGKFGVTGAPVFPGYDCAAQSVLEDVLATNSAGSLSSYPSLSSHHLILMPHTEAL